MKNLLLLAISLPLLLGGCGEKTTVEPELQKRGEYPDKIAYLKGSDTPYTGTQTYWHKNGQKILEATFKDGKFDGLLQRWHENGTKWSEVNYKGGKEDGLQLDWYKNGQKKAEYIYSDGNKLLYTFWRVNGQKVEEYTYKGVNDQFGNPLKDGLSTEWYDNGQKKSEAIYKDGKEISSKEWNEDGSPK